MVIVACLLIDTDWVRDMTNPDLVQRGLQLAAQVQLDGEERALEDGPPSPEAVAELRIELRDRLREGPVVGGTAVTHVEPWRWQAASSGGVAKTEVGREHGCELRFCRNELRVAEP